MPRKAMDSPYFTEENAAKVVVLRGIVSVMSRASEIVELFPGRPVVVLNVLTRLHKLAALAESDALQAEVSDFSELRVEAHRERAVAEVIERYARVLAEGRYSLAQVVELAEEHHRAGADAILSASQSAHEINEARFRGLAAGARLVADVVREEASHARLGGGTRALSA